MANGQSRIARLVLPVSERDHVVGPPEAPVTLVEYGDYQCPYCGAAYPDVESARQRLGPSLRFAYRHFPLAELHPRALPAAEAAEAAGAQGQFWAMHRLLFENQDALDDQDLLRYAAVLDLDLGRFVRDLAEHVWEPRVREDFMTGVRSGVNGTPTFFINGVRHDGAWDAESLVAALVQAARVAA
jgi:protein-disulfide isomerase